MHLSTFEDLAIEYFATILHLLIIGAIITALLVGAANLRSRPGSKDFLSFISHGMMLHYLGRIHLLSGTLGVVLIHIKVAHEASGVIGLAHAVAFLARIGRVRRVHILHLKPTSNLFPRILLRWSVI